MMAPKTLVLLVLLATALVITPAFASRELVQNAQQKAKVTTIHKIIIVAKRMLQAPYGSNSPQPPSYTTLPPQCPSADNCTPP